MKRAGSAGPGGADMKYVFLKETLKKMGSVLVAFSGGVDSTFLLKAAADALGGKVMAATAVSSTYPARELKQARKISKQLGVRHVTVPTDEVNNKKFRANPPDRCYYCKKELFSKLIILARSHGLRQVAEGSNHDDTDDHRPGMKAVAEFGIRSPLLEAGLTKDEIRSLSKDMGLAIWDKPSYACLSSRFPYGTPITKKELFKVSRAEDYLTKLKVGQLRVRVHGDVARIEVPEGDIPVFLNKGIREKAVRKLKAIGYHYVTLDLQGYRIGSMNEPFNMGKGPKPFSH
jgi:uncharacterized protein